MSSSLSEPCPPSTSSGRTDRPVWKREVLLAVLLGVGTVALLAMTNDIGFPRDEGFYFRHSAGYQDWFFDVEQGSDNEDSPALGPDAVSRAWRPNAEHPPLMKILYGFSWRKLAQKVRPIARLETRGEETVVIVTGVRRSGGFHPGERILLLRPSTRGGSSSVEDRVVGSAEVIEWNKNRATARVLEGELDASRYEEICEMRPGDGGVPENFSACQAVAEADVGGMAESMAYRLPAMVFSGLLVAAIYLFGLGFLGRWAALFSALAFLFVPRHFFHAHLTAFDMPVTALIFLTIIAFWHSLNSRKWAVVCGVLWGLAILAKHNAFFVPVVLVLWWLSGVRMVARKGAPPLDPKWIRAWSAGGVVCLALGALFGGLSGVGMAFLLVLMGGAAVGGRLAFPPMPLAFLTMLLIGLPMFFLGWPRMWYDTFENFKWYIDFHLEHEHYMQVYFGEVLGYPPFPVSFPFGMTLLTVPVITLVLAFIGVVRRLRPWLASAFGRWREVFVEARAVRPWSMGALLGIHALYPFLLIALPSTPVFGGVKHWLPAMPFLCLFAGIGFQGLLEGLTRVLGISRIQWQRVCSGILLIVCVAPGVSASMHIHPQGTAYYNSLAGGAAGAADLGMQRQFWGYATRQGLAYLNAHVPHGKAVYFHKCTRSAWDLYRKEGLIREDIQHVADIFDFEKLEKRLKRTAYAVFHHQKDHDEYELVIWRAYGTHAPEWQLHREGVPLLSIYKNPHAR